MTSSSTLPRTHIAIVLDETGSMNMVKAATIEGYNGFLQGQKATDDGVTTISLYKFDLFDTDPICRPVYVEKPLADAPELNPATYNPRGSTPLFDAVAFAIRSVEPNIQPGDRVLIVVQTDGQENASKEFRTKEQIQHLIGDKMQLGNWTFVYLSSDQNGWADGQGMGIPVGNIAAYAPTARGTSEVFASTTDSTTRYRSSAVAQSASFFVPEREAQQPRSKKDTEDDTSESTP